MLLCHSYAELLCYKPEVLFRRSHCTAGAAVWPFRCRYDVRVPRTSPTRGHDDAHVTYVKRRVSPWVAGRITTTHVTSNRCISYFMNKQDFLEHSRPIANPVMNFLYPISISRMTVIPTNSAWKFQEQPLTGLGSLKMHHFKLRLLRLIT